MILNKTAKDLLINSFITKLHLPYNFKKLTAFTLAEVLITLLIIGVVASLVIPALIADTQEAELHTAWKKAYSDIDQAVRRLAIDNGGDLSGSFNNAIDFRDKILTYLNYTKKCSNNQTINICWHNGQSLHRLNGSPENFWATNTGILGAILDNGDLLFMYYRSGNCTDRSGDHIDFDICGQIMVDVNGFKGPNTIGKDIYGIWVKKNGIAPYGTVGDIWTNVTEITTCKNSDYGWGCSAKYLYQ